jgi:Site-specific recombinase XerD
MRNVIEKKPVNVGRKGRDFESENLQFFDLKRMKDGFLMEQKCRGNSEKTITYYDWNITHFIEYLEAQGLPVDTSVITKEEIKKYIVHLKEVKRWEGLEFVNPEGHLASKSVQTYIRASKGWISWMEDEGYLTHIVSKEIKLPKAIAP